MPILCRAEFFDSQLNFIGWAIVENQALEYDALTIGRSELNTRKTLPLVQVRHFCRLLQSGGEAFLVVVSDISTADGLTTVGVKPAQALFDVTVWIDRTALNAGTLEEGVAGILTSVYSGTDELQNITGLVVETTSQTAGELYLEGCVHNISAVLASALKKYGLTVQITLDVTKKELNMLVGVVSDRGWIIEADRPNVTGISIVYDDGINGTNKLTVVNENDETQQVVYYLHTDGSISTEDTNRITPVRPRAITVRSSTTDFEIAALEVAEKTLVPMVYNNMITMIIRKDDAVVRPQQHQIGEPVTVFYNGKTYKSVFTGWRRDTYTFKLYFGAVRLELTRILKMESRKI